jgi:hypothetical protein
MLMDVAGDADATGLGQRLHSCRHVDTVAVQIAAFDDYVAEADTDAQREPLPLGNMRVYPASPAGRSGGRVEDGR